MRWVERVRQQTSLSLTAWFVVAGVFTSSCLLPPERLGLAEQGDDDVGVADVTLDDAASIEDGEPSIDGAEVPDGAEVAECAGNEDCAADAQCAEGSRADTLARALGNSTPQNSTSGLLPMCLCAESRGRGGDDGTRLTESVSVKG